MRKKLLFVTIVALLITCGVWLARSVWRAQPSDKSENTIGLETFGRSTPGQMLHRPAPLAPPDPNRRFHELTPEERVQRARRGPIGG
ncbi:MAG: hypothetical protein AB1813_02540 [Verrucomicrobiota bacterium]